MALVKDLPVSRRGRRLPCGLEIGFPIFILHTPCHSKPLPLCLDEVAAKVIPRLETTLVTAHLGQCPAMNRQLAPSALELPRERSYEAEVLQLPDGQNEDDLDAKCTSKARELGIEPYGMAILQELASNFSGLTVSNAPRRSASIGSRGSHSTGLTSDVSRSSKEHHHGQNGVLYRPVRHRTNSRVSLSVRDYDAVVGHIKPYSRSLSSTPATTPAQSTTSLSLGSPRRHFSKMRGLSQWSKLKRQSRAPSFTDAQP